MANLVAVILKNKAKILDYDSLLQKAKLANEFDREIMLNQELENSNLEIKSSEQAIDRLVYQLYDLDSEDIGVVEAM